MPTETDVEEEQSEVPLCDQKDRPLEEEGIDRSPCNAAAENGFDVALVIGISNHPLGHEHVIGNIKDSDDDDDLPAVKRVRQVHSSDRGVRFLDEWTIELVEADARPPAWNRVLIIRICPSVDDKRAVSDCVQHVVEKIKGVESAWFWKAWEDGLDCCHLWTKSGREFLRLRGRSCRG